jgi:tripartite-type tricarboxylate transporter receptor subunit TctC
MTPMKRARSCSGNSTVSRRLLCIVAVAALPCAPAQAQQWPAKPLRLIVPFPPGGGSDIVGRILAQRLSDQLKQQVVVDNRAGAGGSIGTEAAVKAAPDGYTTVLASASEIAVNPALYSRLAYDTVRDLAPVAAVAATPIVAVVHPSLPVRTVQDLAALARAKPGEINLASAGNGTFTHLAGELFRSQMNLKWTHVPYKGAPPALTDLASGQVQVMFSTVPAAMALIRAQRLKPIAVSSAKRVESLPDVPTARESGAPQYEVEYWWGVFAPSATPGNLITQLHNEVAAALRTPDVIANLAKQGAVPLTQTQPRFAELVKTEHDKWGKVVRSAGVKID